MTQVSRRMTRAVAMRLVVAAAIVTLPLRGAAAGPEDIVVRGIDNHIYINSSPDGGLTWSGWSEVPGGGLTSGSPAVVPRGAELDVVVQGQDSGVYINTRKGDGSWSGWRAVGGLTASGPGLAAGRCGAEAVQAGPVCVDKYEASVWSSPAGGTQYGAVAKDYPCSPTGNDCMEPKTAFAFNKAIYARSVAGVTPSRFITWFQAQQACANVGKRLLTNAEWQLAAAGTLGSPPCIVSVAGPGPTGTVGCVSNWGTFDMVGNVWEWVADWVPLSTACPPSLFGTNDYNCLAGASTTYGPGALLRGGGFFSSGTGAGVFAVSGLSQPSGADSDFGFRCGR